MIGLSPLSTGHPLRFQPKWVRPSTGSYPRFSLPMDSSPGFASAASDCVRHLKGSLSLRLGSNLNLAAYRNSLAHSTKGTPSHCKSAPTACRRTVSGTISLFCSKCFSPFPHGTGSLSVIGECLALEGGPPRFIPGFTCPALLGIPLSGPRSFGYGALTLYRPASQPVPLDRGFLTRPRRSSDGTEGPTTPRAATPGGLHAHGFRLLRFRSPLLAQSRLISFPPGT